MDLPTTLAAILTVAQNLGYPTLLVVVMAESAGIPVPGETALITAAILASQAHLDIITVIAVAALAAVLGDNIGYLVARRAGRGLLERPGPFLRQRRRVLEIGEPFFARHGPKAVFLGRWVLGLRTWTAWLAGASAMPWRSFAFWNALGGTTWAVTVGLAAYLVGTAAKDVLSTVSMYVPAIVVVLGGAVLVIRRRPRADPDPPPAASR